MPVDQHMVKGQYINNKFVFFFDMHVCNFVNWGHVQNVSFYDTTKQDHLFCQVQHIFQQIVKITFNDT